MLNSFIYAYTDGYEATDASDLVKDEPKYALKSIQKSIKPSDLVNLDTLGGTCLYVQNHKVQTYVPFQRRSAHI